MIIRNMREEDISQVCEIEKDLFSLPWKASDFLSVIKNENNIYLVIEIDGDIAGYCGLWGIVDEGYINNVAVARKYQNQGLGHEILTNLLKRGRLQGLISFTLEVRVSNEKAIYLYKKLGFRDSGVRPNFYSFPIEDALIMWL